VEESVGAAFVEAFAVAVGYYEGELTRFLAGFRVAEVGEGDGDVGLDFGGPGWREGTGRRQSDVEKGEGMIEEGGEGRVGRRKGCREERKRKGGEKQKTHHARSRTIPGPVNKQVVSIEREDRKKGKRTVCSGVRRICPSSETGADARPRAIWGYLKDLVAML
jgi:hypothetical protein